MVFSGFFSSLISNIYDNEDNNDDNTLFDNATYFVEDFNSILYTNIGSASLYNLGNKRTLEEYQNYSGIDYTRNILHLEKFFLFIEVFKYIVVLFTFFFAVGRLHKFVQRPRKKPLIIFYKKN